MGNLALFAKITLISLGFICSVGGCGSMTPEEAQAQADVEMTKEALSFLQFGMQTMIDSGAGDGILDGIGDTLGGILDDDDEEDPVAPAKALTFSNFQPNWGSLPFCVDGPSDQVSGEGETTHTLDLTFTFCPHDQEEPASTDTVETSGLPEGGCRLDCGGAEPEEIHIVGSLTCNDETNLVTEGGLTVNGNQFESICDFAGAFLDQLAFDEGLLNELCNVTELP